MEKVLHYRQLKVWQQSLAISKQLYQLTEDFPKREWFGLAGQMRRAAVSIPSNIAEGNARHTKKDYRHFIAIALGSTAELETQIALCIELHYLKEGDANTLLSQLDEVGRMLRSIHKKLAPSP